MTANARTEANARRTLRLRTEKFDELARVILGPLNVRQTAERLGFDHRHFSSLRTGNKRPGPEFIAAVRTAMPNAPFDDLFEVVDLDEGDSEAASTAGAA